MSANSTTTSGDQTPEAPQDVPNYDTSGEAISFSEYVDLNIGDTCCGECPGASCYVDFLTGERS